MTRKRDTRSPASVLQRLRNACVEGQTAQNAQVLFVLERFLVRMARSRYRDRLVLKGGILLHMMLRQWVRPTEDLDVLAMRLPSEELDGVLTEILAIDGEDGLEFDVGAIKWEDIREESGYPCRRFTIPYRFGLKHTHFIKLDVSFGDPVTPDPQFIEVRPILEEFQGGAVLGYPVETFLAEKIETLVTRGLANTRSKDIHDLWVISRSTPDLHLEGLANALAATATFRGTHLDPDCDALKTSFAQDERQSRYWAAYIGSKGLVLPSFQEVMARVQAFARPVVESATMPGRSAIWDSASGTWN